MHSFILYKIKRRYTKAIPEPYESVVQHIGQQYVADMWHGDLSRRCSPKDKNTRLA